MTVLEVENLIFGWFSENDCLIISKDIDNPKDDFKKLILLSVDKNKELALLKCALEEYEKSGILKKSEDETRYFWFLKKPFSSYEQTIVIEPAVASMVSKVINHFCESTNDKTDLCDPQKITNKDIKNLCFLITHFSSKVENEE